MSERIFRIAIDGPSGAGKSTIAKAVAKRLGIDYIDPGGPFSAWPSAGSAPCGWD